MGKRNRARIIELRRSVWLRRKRKIKIFLSVVLLSVLVYGTLNLKRFITGLLLNVEAFTLTEVTIAPHNAEPVISSAVEIEKGGNLLFFDIELLREKIEGIPEIKSCSIKKEFPSSISIEVVLRKPFAGIRCGDVNLLLDETGRVLPLESAGGFIYAEGIAISDGRVAPEDINKIVILEELNRCYHDYRIDEYFPVEQVVLFSENNIILKSGNRQIRIDSEDLPGKFNALRRLLLYCNSQSQKWQYIDARFNNFYVKHL